MQATIYPTNPYIMKERQKIYAHCDGPCGVYDPSSARIAAEAVFAMTQKLLELKHPEGGDDTAHRAYLNTFSRYVAIKEQEAQKCKDELLILWTDFFKPEHLADQPDLHDIFWKAAKLCSDCKVSVDLVHAQELLEAVRAIHQIFWSVKRREVPWVTATLFQ